MKFRTKIMLLFVFLAFFTNGVLFAILYVKSRSLVYRQIQSKVLSIASTIASFTDGDLHKSIRVRDDEHSQEYAILEKQLQTGRDANRRDDVYVSYVYTMTVAPEKSDVIQFGVDAEEEFENKSHVGDVYKGKYDSPLRMADYQVDERFTEDQWGVWLSANAPIKDTSGQVVASLGVDVSALDVIGELKKVFLAGIVALGISITLAVVFALLVSKKVSTPLYALQGALQSIGKGDLDARVTIFADDEFGEVGRTINEMAAGLKERNTIKSLFERYVSPQVANNILKSGDLSELTGARRKVTVLFSDIREFTRLTENMSPEDVVRMLNEYFDKMVAVVYKNHGEPYKFIGDGMMVVFGAPSDDNYQEENAVKTALEMRAVLNELCKKWKAEGRFEICMGIGINSGNVIAGNIGSMQRMEYTVIGDTVNLASRLESSTKDLGADILVSEYTYNAVRNAFTMKNMGSIQVKGRNDPVTVYSVLGMKG